MRKEDGLLIKRTEQAIRELEEDYDEADFAEQIDKKAIKRNIHLEILTCETIIEECKIEVNDSSIEDIIATLNLVYHMKLKKNEPLAALVKLDQVTSKFLSSKKHNKKVDEALLDAYRKDMKLIVGIKNALHLRVQQLDKLKKWFIIPQVLLISKYEKYIETLSALEKKMKKDFQYMSDLVTTYIVESFHYVYLYYSYIIKYFLYSDNEIVLVEVASSIDRFIKIMKPIKEKTSLKNENLRNFYVIYEFNLLKQRIMNHYK